MGEVMQSWKVKNSEYLKRPGQTGLEDGDRRSLIRLIFFATGVTMGLFAVLQIGSGNILLAIGELIAAVILIWGAWRISSTRQVNWWIYMYLVPLYGFLLYIIVMPAASPMAFVWVYFMPVLSYLLLGRLRGFLVAAPFSLLALALYLQRYGFPTDPLTMIDVGNGVFCGVLIFLFVHMYETRRAAAQLALERMAETDALTGVANRGGFQRALERAVDECGRSQTPLVLIMMDVDNFKNVNDKWGHDAGDSALQHISMLLQERLRSTDTIGRMGGEEFGLVLRSTEYLAATDLAESLRVRIAATPLLYKQQSIELSATFGLAQWALDADTAEDLYRIADQRVYRGKAGGRNQVVSNDGALETRSPAQSSALAL